MGRPPRQSSASTKPSTANVRLIDKLHRQLTEVFSPNLENKIVIGSTPDSQDSWKRRAFLENVEFQMWNDGTPQFYGERKGGRSRSPITQIRHINNSWETKIPYVSWREIWIAHQQQEFELKEATFTFFWGQSTRVDDQILRAEWVQSPHGSKTSAQPHWHIDWLVTEGAIDISGLHLAMAGWLEADHEPGCWQKHVNGNWDQLILWANRTLAYARTEIGKYLDPTASIIH